MTIDVIDLFAGPGGLGEGFASLDNGNAFQIAVSAEMESSAHKTLMLRAFFRHAQRVGDLKAIDTYYAYCNYVAAPHPSTAHPSLWAAAKDEARQLTLGDPASNDTLDQILRKKKLRNDNTVLIGGPPCQAYSLVGRSRNLGKKDYVPEEDHRHFLYQEYLRILAKEQPAVFVMENVKGILSSKLNGHLVFHDILKDLTNPRAAAGQKKGARYTIYSLSSETKYTSDMEISEIDPADFIVRAEEHGIPQARHRVILLGVKEGFEPTQHPLLTRQQQRTVGFALRDLPRLRSRLSTNDSPDGWYQTVTGIARGFANEARHRKHPLAGALFANARTMETGLPTGDDRLKKGTHRQSSDDYLNWVRDERIDVWLHHAARSHMASDLGRYFYSATFAEHFKRSPKGDAEFDLDGLAPAHANWKTGKFCDRFRTQVEGAPSSTVTSHIAKDGHYFIHHDPAQCRSLTIREAARLQSFRDNYFFEGNRTEKYHQVGNAVPPLLAQQIAALVLRVFRQGPNPKK